MLFKPNSVYCCIIPTKELNEAQMLLLLFWVFNTVVNRKALQVIFHQDQQKQEAARCAKAWTKLFIIVQNLWIAQLKYNFYSIKYLK